MNLMIEGEQANDKTNEITCAPSEDQISQGILPVSALADHSLRCPHEETFGS